MMALNACLVFNVIPPGWPNRDYQLRLPRLLLASLIKFQKTTGNASPSSKNRYPRDPSVEFSEREISLFQRHDHDHTNFNRISWFVDGQSQDLSVGSSSLLPHGSGSRCRPVSCTDPASSAPPCRPRSTSNCSAGSARSRSPASAWPIGRWGGRRDPVCMSRLPG